MSVNTYINGQLVRVSGSSTQTQSDAIQVAALPTASAQYVGKVYQYIGNDTETAKHGLFYGCIEENSEYKWVQVNTDPDTESISNEKLAAMWGTDLSVVDVQALHVTSNDTYNAPNGAAYNPVVVDTEAWEPLDDGYNNFWFELTNDTLSPWLNFSAKNNDAVIDWGDGSGEQPLDTLTPTHIYSKAGMYIVKVKGITGIDVMNLNTVTNSAYFRVLKNIELNSDITSIVTYAFRRCVGIKNVKIGTNTVVNAYAFQYCANLRTINYSDGAQTNAGAATFYNCVYMRHISLPNDITAINQAAFYNCVSLQNITIPASVASIGNNAFNGCTVLTEIHVLSTTPPTMGTNPFGSISSSYIIYVPAGYGNTYKAASGWSDYADHIVEES